MSCLNLEKDPEYIEESPEIILLKTTYTHEIIGVQKGHLSMGFSLLVHTLFIMFNDTLFSKLVSVADNYNTSSEFSECMKLAVKKNNWSHKSSLIALCAMRKILSKTNISISFINKILIEKNKSISRNSIDFCLPAAYKKLPSENETRKTILYILQECKQKSNYQSISCLRIFISFILKLLKELEIEITDYFLIKEIDKTFLDETIKRTQPFLDYKKKILYTQVFIVNILGCIDHSIFFKNCKNYQKLNRTKLIEDSSDKHRITKEELELMNEEAKKNIRNETLFILMMTTGMRACGVSNIKMENICNIVNGEVLIKNTGKTLEKGLKWFSFMISENLSKLLYNWITKNRKGCGFYLFPGKGENIGISTNRINRIIKNIAVGAGLVGPHIHAHSIRHSYAHILLEIGNSIENVSKLMGHSSVSTTEKYYLKESATEVANRSNIPWLKRNKNINSVPNFLKENKSKKKKISKICKSDALKLLHELRKTT